MKKILFLTALFFSIAVFSVSKASAQVVVRVGPRHHVVHRRVVVVHHPYRGHYYPARRRHPYRRGY